MEKSQGIRLDLNSYKKTKDFAITNNTTISEICKALIKSAPIKLENLRNNSVVVSESLQDKKLQNIKGVAIYLDDKLANKLQQMKIKNDYCSYTEIIKVLIKETDLTTLKFKTNSEIYTKSNKGKKK